MIVVDIKRVLWHLQRSMNTTSHRSHLIGNVSHERYLAGREYWKYLTLVDLFNFWRHYTTGSGAGLYAAITATTPFDIYVVESAEQSAWEKAHNV